MCWEQSAWWQPLTSDPDIASLPSVQLYWGTLPGAFWERLSSTTSWRTTCSPVNYSIWQVLGLCECFTHPDTDSVNVLHILTQTVSMSYTYWHRQCQYLTQTDTDSVNVLHILTQTVSMSYIYRYRQCQCLTHTDTVSVNVLHRLIQSASMLNRYRYSQCQCLTQADTVSVNVLHIQMQTKCQCFTNNNTKVMERFRKLK